MLSTQLRQLIRRYPSLRNILRRFYRSSQYNSARLLGRIRRDNLQLVYVDPNRIQKTVNKNDPTLTGNAVWHIGSIDDGDWDLGGIAVQDHDHVYSILAKHLQQYKAFADIPEFQANIHQIEAGKIVDSCASLAEYHDRWQGIVDLYKNIEQNGYKTQIELKSNNILDEIRVQIGRKGEFLFEEGLHRLVIAQQLKLSVVPVLITRRHADWAELRSAVLKIVVQRGFIHQPFDHPDLDSLPYQYGNKLAQKAFYGHDRWHLIHQSLPLNNGTVLDIGAYFGYFDHRFEDLGFKCYAVEPDHENLAVLNQYRSMYDRQFTIWPQSIFEIDRFEFDIVLALNIFHHFVRTKHDYNRLIALLNQLRCQALYLEPDQNDGIESYKHFNDEEFVEFVLKNTRLKKSRYLGQAKEGRPLFLLT